eukprot:scaffold14_cov130-Cylindrotheca_fusiformis.AAC.13
MVKDGGEICKLLYVMADSLLILYKRWKGHSPQMKGVDPAGPQLEDISYATSSLVRCVKSTFSKPKIRSESLFYEENTETQHPAHFFQPVHFRLEKQCDTCFEAASEVPSLSCGRSCFTKRSTFADRFISVIGRNTFD